MTRGPLQLFRRRTLRRFAAFAAGLLMAGHVLAATGLCMAPAPEAPAPVHQSGAACEDHGLADTGAPVVKHHCPGEEPTPQARSADLPAPQPVAVVATVSFLTVDPAADRLVQAIPEHAVPPPPLFARLQQRFRL